MYVPPFRSDYNANLARYITAFDDLCLIRSLDMQSMGDDLATKEEFKKRGAQFVKLKGRHYLQYNDLLLRRSSFGQVNKYKVCQLLDFC
jgi:hypothetical protein